MRYAPLLVATQLLTAGCTGTPGFVLASPDPIVPAGPKIAALEVNLKCGLQQAVTSPAILTDYVDGYDGRIGDVARQPVASAAPLAREHPDQPMTQAEKDAQDRAEQDAAARQFTLANLFREIDYVGELQLTLDVTNTGGVTPSITYADPLHAAKGLLPATSFTLGVSGTLSDAAHRNIVLYQSVEFGRLLPQSDVDEGGSAQTISIRQNGTPNSMHDTLPACPPNYRPNGFELRGDLKLREAIATAIEGVAMSDINVFIPPPPPKPPLPPAQPPAADQRTTDLTNEVSQLTKLLAGQQDYQFGQFTAQVDFTVTEGVGGGPNWSLDYLKFPSTSAGSGPSLASVQRVVKDTLLLTMVPVCIRDGFRDVLGTEALKDPAGKPTPPSGAPPVMHGTPHWANFLPPCHPSPAQAAAGASYDRLLRAGLSVAHFTNLNSTFLRTQGSP